MKRWRFSSVLLCIAVLYVLLGWNMYHLQVLKGDYYSARAESRYRPDDEWLKRRGKIYLTDRSGNPIPAALSKEFPVVYAVPKEIEDPETAARAVAEILNLDEDNLREAFGKPGDPYEPVKKRVTEEEARLIKALDLRGLYVDAETSRFYPFEQLAAHVLGFVGSSSDLDRDGGRYGIELLNEDALASGGDVALTLDRNIQAQAEKVIGALAREYNATSGTVIVEDPKTGKIL